MPNVTCMCAWLRSKMTWLRVTKKGALVEEDSEGDNVENNLLVETAPSDAHCGFTLVHIASGMCTRGDADAQNRHKASTSPQASGIRPLACGVNVRTDGRRGRWLPV
eukprot:scaffold601529_cov18-Prasinocladus_malaysianus.AAC.1